MFPRMPRSLVWSQLIATVGVLALVAGCSSSGSTPTPHSSAPSASPSSSSGPTLAPNPVGKPKGASVTKTIGSAGGSLSSGDGRVSVTIPAGALTKDTPVAIQPIENTAAGGLGAAYRLSPTGQTFAQPVQVSFAYTAADVQGSAPEALGVAFQDGRGLWEWQDTVALDTAAKRLSVMTKHFSDWSSVKGLQLLPASATVRVKGQVSLAVTSCVSVGKYSVTYLRYKCGVTSGEDLADLGPQVQAGTWSVDGKTGGNPTLGSVKGDESSATYTAPARKPAGIKSVAVSVTATSKGKKTLLVSNVTILGGYRIKGTFKATKSNLICAGAISASVTDTVEFSLKPGTGDTYTVTNIKNGKTVYTAPVVPDVGLRPSVKGKPDILFVTKGTVDFGNDDLITVSLTGLYYLASCYYGGAILGTGSTSLSRAGLSFYTTQFTDGTQKGISEDSDQRRWTWVVTEQ
jgi:hypothetical protein